MQPIFDLQPTQTELVLLIFLRLAEDVLIFQTVPNQRRREIMTGLTMNMKGIFSFFMTTLRSSYDTYQQMVRTNVSHNTFMCITTTCCHFDMPRYVSQLGKSNNA